MTRYKKDVFESFISRFAYIIQKQSYCMSDSTHFVFFILNYMDRIILNPSHFNVLPGNKLYGWQQL